MVRQSSCANCGDDSATAGADSVDLDCPRCQIAAIVGPGGCGKTVLLKRLNLLLRPDSGKSLSMGSMSPVYDHAALTPSEKFGMLFQAGALFDSMSVFDNVAFPLVQKTKVNRNQIPTQVHEILSPGGTQGYGGKYPSDRVAACKSVQRWRARLFDVLKILMLDEPTTGSIQSTSPQSTNEYATPNSVLLERSDGQP